MNKLFLLAAACILVILCGSCDESFNPSAAFKPRMVVYSVLRTDSDTQYVRIYSSYLPPGNDPTENLSENSVTDAAVKVTGTNPLYDARISDFRFLEVKRLDESRYQNDIGAYYCYPFRPIRGASYRLTAVSPTYGIVTAETTVPGQATVALVNPSVLENPFSASMDFGIKIGLAPEAKAYVAHIYINYLWPPGDGTYQPRRIEVPLSRETVDCIYQIFKETYPLPTLRSTPAVAPAIIGGVIAYQAQESVPYNRISYQHKIFHLYGTEGNGILMRQEVTYVAQFDTSLWDYYSVANLFHDKYSVRTDEPDYTNVSNGVGVFGSMTVDSLIWRLPQVMPHPQNIDLCW